MSRSNDKYLMFKNFMMNELGITKEDIRNQINESVKEEARKLAENSFKETPKQIVRKVMYENNWYSNYTQKELNHKIIEEVAKIISSNLNIEISKK